VQANKRKEARHGEIPEHPMSTMSHTPSRLAGFLCGVLMVCFASTPQAQGWRESSLAVGGVERWYRVYAPQTLARHAAVVVVLHGGTESMRTLFKEKHDGGQWLKLADREGVLLVVPNGVNGHSGDAHGDRQNWNDLRGKAAEVQSQADDVGFIRALLGRIGTEHDIDPRRIYVTGVSNGGMMTYRLLIEMPERFAAGAAFVAHLPRETDRLRPPARPVPLMMWSGTSDPVMKFDGGEITGGRGDMRSARDTVAWWLAANRADANGVRVELLPDADPDDGCRIEKSSYPALPGGAPVTFYRAEGGGHGMPSTAATTEGFLRKRLIGPTCKDAEGAELAWAFLRNFDLPR
jgi:polyhydroxybutyrate depolymerase